MSRCETLYIQSSNYVGWYIIDRDGDPVTDAVVNLTIVDPITLAAVDGVTWPVLVPVEDVATGLYSVVIPPEMDIIRDKAYLGQLNIVSAGSGTLYMETPYQSKVKS